MNQKMLIPIGLTLLLSMPHHGCRRAQSSDEPSTKNAKNTGRRTGAASDVDGGESYASSDLPWHTDSDTLVERTLATDTITPTSACDPSRQPVSDFDWIADFEGSGWQAGNSSQLYVGFYAKTDDTPGVELAIEKGRTITGDSIDGCTSTFICFGNRGGQFEKWGGQLEMMFGMDANGYPISKDLTAYKGIFFWAMQLGSLPYLRVDVPNTEFFPDLNTCNPAGEKSVCTEGRTASILFDHVGIWEPVEILFDFLNPPTYEFRTPFDRTEVYGLQFVLSQGMDLQYCIDDIYLIPDETAVPTDTEFFSDGGDV